MLFGRPKKFWSHDAPGCYEYETWNFYKYVEPEIGAKFYKYGPMSNLGKIVAEKI